MSLYTLIVGPPDWRFGIPLPFSREVHDAWRERLEPDTRIIFYDLSREAIIGEGSVHGIFIRPQEWPSSSTNNLPSSVANAEYVLPVRVLYQREANALIPLAEVRRALQDDSFPNGVGDLRELDGEAYQLLTQDWP